MHWGLGNQLPCALPSQQAAVTPGLRPKSWGTHLPHPVRPPHTGIGHLNPGGESVASLPPQIPRRLPGRAVAYCGSSFWKVLSSQGDLDVHTACFVPKARDVPLQAGLAGRRAGILQSAAAPSWRRGSRRARRPAWAGGHSAQCQAPHSASAGPDPPTARSSLAPSLARSLARPAGPSSSLAIARGLTYILAFSPRRQELR
jgi:hypothetical protein